MTFERLVRTLAQKMRFTEPTRRRCRAVAGRTARCLCKFR